MVLFQNDVSNGVYFFTKAVDVFQQPPTRVLVDLVFLEQRSKPKYGPYQLLNIRVVHWARTNFDK